MPIDQFISSAATKTRVLLLSKEPINADFFIKILKLTGKSIDYCLTNGVIENQDHDFALLECADPQNSADFQPNIVLVTDDYDESVLNTILEEVVAGGIAIYPDRYQETVEEQATFFRRMPYETRQPKAGNENLVESPLGPLHLSTKFTPVIPALNGLQFLAQQLGIMEEEFYEACAEID